MKSQSWNWFAEVEMLSETSGNKSPDCRAIQGDSCCKIIKALDREGLRCVLRRDAGVAAADFSAFAMRILHGLPSIA